MEGFERTRNQLIDSVYQAASSPSEWPEVLQHIADAFGACNTLIYCSDAKKNNLIEFEQAAFGFVKYQDYKDYYCTLDPWNLLWNKVPLDRAYPNFDVVNYKHFKKSEIYADFWKAQEFLHTCGGVFLRDDHYFGIAAFQVSKPASAPARKSVKLLECLMPHLRHALQLQHRITSQMQLANSIHQSLDQLPYGVILIRANMRIDYCNKKANDILDETNSLIINNDRLHTNKKESDLKLQTSIRECIRNSDNNKKSSFVIDNKHSLLQLYFYPFRKNSSLNNDGTAPVRAAIFILDSSNISLPSANEISQILGISKAQSVLARGLYEGKDINQLSEERGVTVNTTRSQTKSIFKKTGVHSKSQLIRRMHDIHRLTIK